MLTKARTSAQAPGPGTVVRRVVPATIRLVVALVVATVGIVVVICVMDGTGGKVRLVVRKGHRRTNSGW